MILMTNFDKKKFQKLNNHSFPLFNLAPKESLTTVNQPHYNLPQTNNAK